MQSIDATLEFCDEPVLSAAATKEDLERVLERQPRPDDWYLTLWFVGVFK